jgi:hypothetical protein
MKSNFKLLYVTLAVSMSACQPGIITGNDASKKTGSAPAAVPVIKAGLVPTSGTDMGVESAVPTPTPSGGASNFKLKKILGSLFMNDAYAGPSTAPTPGFGPHSIEEDNHWGDIPTSPTHTFDEGDVDSWHGGGGGYAASIAPKHLIYENQALITLLELKIGAQKVVSLKSQYQQYLQDHKLTEDLKQSVSFDFKDNRARTSSVTMPMTVLLDPNSAVITLGTKAYYGLAKVGDVSLMAITGKKIINKNGVLIVAGGKHSGGANKNQGRIELLNDGQFKITTSSFTNDSSAADVVVLQIDQAVATAANLVPASIGTHLLVARVNSLKQVTVINLLDLSTGILKSSMSTVCATVLPKLTAVQAGLTCKPAGNPFNPGTIDPHANPGPYVPANGNFDFE